MGGAETWWEEHLDADGEAVRLVGDPPLGRFLLVTAVRNAVALVILAFIVVAFTALLPGVPGLQVTGLLGEFTLAPIGGPEPVSVPFSVILLAAALPALLEHRRAGWVLTDRRLLVQGGLLSGGTTAIPIDDVEEVTLETGLVDRLAGTGTIEVTVGGAGPGVATLEVVPHPRRVLATFHDTSPAGGAASGGTSLGSTSS